MVTTTRPMRVQQVNTWLEGSNNTMQSVLDTGNTRAKGNRCFGAHGCGRAVGRGRTERETYFSFLHRRYLSNSPKNNTKLLTHTRCHKGTNARRRGHAHVYKGHTPYFYHRVLLSIQQHSRAHAEGVSLCLNSIKRTSSSTNRYGRAGKQAVLRRCLEGGGTWQGSECAR